MKNKQLKILQYLNTLRALGFDYHDAVTLKKQSVDFILPRSLVQLSTIVSNCSLCELSKSRKNVVFGQGNTLASIVFIGDTPSISEDENGDVLAGKAGELLEKIIQNVLQKQTSDFYFTNIIKCKTPNNRLPSPSEINCCKEYLDKQLEIISPKLIVALGSTSFKYLIGSNENISQARGKILPYSKNISLIATYHPSFLLRNPSSKKEAFEDFKVIKRFLDSLV